MNYWIDLILGKAFCIFIFFHVPDSRLSVLKKFPFLFLLSHVSENWELQSYHFEKCIKSDKNNTIDKNKNT